MPIVQASYDPTTRIVTVQEDGETIPSDSVDIGKFSHPDENYPDSYVIFHGVRELLYHRDIDGSPSFWPDNITDMQSISIESQLVAEVPLIDFTVLPTTVSIEVGNTEQINVTYNPSNTTQKELTYESDAEAVATVSNSGLITGVSAGSATVTVKSDKGGTDKTVSVTVT